jgi:hypothetical protein
MGGGKDLAVVLAFVDKGVSESRAREQLQFSELQPPPHDKGHQQGLQIDLLRFLHLAQ